jgi:tetratricopeptide (TPR) repeat protein
MAGFRFFLALLCALALGFSSAAAQKKKKKTQASKPAASASAQRKTRAAATQSTASPAAEEEDATFTSTSGTAVAAGARGAAMSDAGGMCIAPAVKEQLNVCSADLGKGRGTGSGAPKSQLHSAKRKVEPPKGIKDRGPSVELDLATLRNKEKLETKAESLLRREIGITQRLIKNTRTSDGRRPDYLLRLAEGYFELVQLATANVRKLDEPVYDACQRKKNAGKCNQTRQAQKKAEEVLEQTREQNIKTLALLVKDHPTYKRMDEVLFSLGFSLEEMKQFDRARQVYHRLIKNHPQSEFIPNAYLSFAEYYFQEGDMRAAKQFYSKVTEIPPERNKVYGYALYKMAWCDFNLEDFKASLQHFVETIEFGTQHPEAANVQNLVVQSRKELVVPYAQVGDPGRALDFFRRFSKDDDQAYAMFESLGELYFDTGQWPKVIAVYHKLMAERSTDDKVCYWQTRVSNAVISSSPKAKQVTEIERLVDLWESYDKAKHAEEAKATCKTAAASVLIDSATAWHREAIGTETQPGTNDRSTMELSAKLYRLLLKRFPEMERMEFPDIDKRDWPTEYKVSYYYAELLWKMENWAQCGPAFDHVLEVNPKGEYTEDAAYASVLCYNKQYQTTFAGGERVVKHRDAKPNKRKKGQDPEQAELAAKFRAKELSPLESGMLNAYQRYVCFVPNSEDLPTIKYRRARIYYETNHFEEAALLFKDIAFNHTDTEMSVFAANLYLDSLNVLGSYSDPARPKCFDDMTESIEPLANLYCKTPEAKESNAELCNVLEQLRCDLLRKKAEALQASSEYKKAAQLYVNIFRQYSECGRLEEVLYNASLNFEAARLLGRAIKVRRVLVDKYPESEWAKRAIYLMGANFHALAMYDMAADNYEKFATKYPGELGEKCTEGEKKAGTCANAKEAMQNAVFFRLGLGNEAKAVEDAKIFDQNYRRRFPREASQVNYSLGSIYEREANWKKAIDHYTNFLKAFRKTALPHEIIQANVSAGRAYLMLGASESKGNEKQREATVESAKSKAGPYFDAAVKEWRASKDDFDKLPVPDDQKQRFLAFAKIGTAEALFNQANRELDKFRRIKFPLFDAKAKARGGDARRKELQEKFNKWQNDQFVKWMGEKAKALERTQKSYEGIAELQVPQWDIAAATRIGDMYLSFVNDFRDAPVPPVLQGDEELVSIYYQGLDEASKPWVEKAKGAYEFCLITATKVRWFNEYMTRCEEELFKLDPRQYPRAAEIRGSDTYQHTTYAAPGAIELTTSADEDVEGGE